MTGYRALHMNKELKQSVVDCLLGDKPMFNAEIMEETGCTKWQVTCVRKELAAKGFVLKKKRQPVKKTQFVLHGRTEEESDAARQKERSNESDSLKEARRRHRRLVNLDFKREVKEIFSDPLDIGINHAQ